MLFSEYVDLWKSEARSNVGESWRITQDKLIGLHILPVLSSDELSAIGPSHISKVLEISQGKGHSAKTRMHLYSIMFKMFDDAVEFFELDLKNPVKKKYHRPKITKKKSKFMTLEQSILLLEYVLHSQFSHAVWIQTLSGLRVSEVLPLRWGDMDFENDQINVVKIYNRNTKKIQDHTKNGNQVYIPMPVRLKKYLLKYRGKNDDFVIPNQKNKMTCYFVYRRYLRNVCEKLKLPIRSAHGLRHSCTEIWVNVGASAEDLRRLLNHKSLSATDSYIHRTDGRLNLLSKKIS